MSHLYTLSQEAESVLKEIVQNEGVPDYWSTRFEELSSRDDAILRGCFKELADAELIKVQWADNIPYLIHIFKDGYLYGQHKAQQNMQESNQPFETELNALLERTETIKVPINIAPMGTSISDYNRPSQDWINDFEIFFNKYLKEHSLASRIESILFHRTLSAYSDLTSCLRSISKDQSFIQKMRRKVASEHEPAKGSGKMYDVFLSHANADKVDIVENLYQSLRKLGIDIFYDKESLEWGDNWKKRILEGVAQAEFAIIVISRNFFGRE